MTARRLRALSVFGIGFGAWLLLPVAIMAAAAPPPGAQPGSGKKGASDPATGIDAGGDAPALGAADAGPADARTDSEATVAGTEAGAESPPEPSPVLQKRIGDARNQAAKLTTRVLALQTRGMLTSTQARRYDGQIDGWIDTLSSLDKSPVATERSVAAAETGLSAIADQLDEQEKASGWDLVGKLLQARCATAICFDNGPQKDWIGVEPLVELPVGKSAALSGSSLSNYIDNHDLRVDLAAGLRVWLFRDVISLSVYISKPLTDARVRLAGSNFTYPAASVRRPYPGVALGALFDSLWIGFDFDELRNGDGQDSLAVNTDFPPNTLISSSWTLTVALQPVTAFRTAIGTGVQATKGKSP